MTKHEALIAHCSSALLTKAINANRYATEYPAKAAEAADAAEGYANWLNANGRQVDLEVQEVNGQRRFVTVTIDGKTWVRNGAFVQAASDR